MPDSLDISARITADSSQLDAAMDSAAARTQRFAAEMKRAGNDLTRIDATFVETGQRAQAMAAQVQAASRVMAASIQQAATGGLTKLAVNAGEAREAIVLLHEAFTGRFNRIPGSLMVLAERFGSLDSIVAGFRGVLLSPWAPAAAGIAAVAGVLGALTVEEVRAQNQIQDTVDSLTVLGRSTGTTVDDLAAMRDRFQDTFNLGTAAAGDLVDAIAKLPPSVAGSADAIAQIAVQVAKLKDEDLPKAAEEAGKAAEKGGKAFLEWAQQLGFQLDPALVRAIDELEKTSGKVTSAQAAIVALSAVINNNVGAWQRDTAAVRQFQDAVSGLATMGIGGMPQGMPAPGTMPPPHPEPQIQPFGAFGFDADPKATAAAEKDVNAAALVTLQTQVRITAQLKEREAHLAALQKLHALEVDQGREGPAQAKAEVAAGMSQYDAAQARHGARGAQGSDYQSFAEGERQKIEEARGDQAQISAIYDEWLAHAASVYGTDSTQYKRVLLEKTEAARRAAQQMGEETLRSVSTQRAADESYLAAFKANMAAMVATHKISKDQEYGFDIQYTAQLHDQLTQQLTAIKNNVALGAQAQERAWQELIEVGASFNAKIAEDQAKAAEAASTVWQNATRQILDAFATAATDVITRTKSISSAFSDLLNSLIKDVAQSSFKSLFNCIIGSGGGSGGGSGSSGGILGDLFSSVFGSIFGKGISGLFSSGAGGLAGDFDAEGGIGAAVSSSGGGLFSWLGSLLPALPAFAQGGIVPSAAGGWSVPQLGSGGVLAQLHSQEMVLPANVSSAVMNMANNGGGSGHTFNLGPIVALDAPSVAKLFASNGSVLVAALNKALRNGSSLYS
jgi:hypothetical protein